MKTLSFTSPLETAASEKSWVWWQERKSQREGNFSVNAFLKDFSIVRRYFGKRNIGFSSSQEREYQEMVGWKIPFSLWSEQKIARIQLLLELSSLSDLPNSSNLSNSSNSSDSPNSSGLPNLSNLQEKLFQETVEKCYYYGDNNEQIAVLQALFLLPNCSRFVSLALDTIRTNVTTVFTGLACENPFPAICLDEHSFNNVVLKALFSEVPLGAILGLKQRHNSSLADMIHDWMDEREAARRSIPTDIWRILCNDEAPRTQERIRRYLRGEDSEHRYGVAYFLNETPSLLYQKEIAQQLEQEKDSKIRALLEQIARPKEN